MGLRRKKEPRWTSEDIQFLRENWGKLTYRQLANRLGRTINGILVKSKKLKLGPIHDQSCFDKCEICELLRVDHRKVDRWIASGLLKAKVAKTARKYGKSRNIIEVNPEELLRFLRENQDLWDARKAGDIMKAVRKKELLAEKIADRDMGCAGEEGGVKMPAIQVQLLFSSEMVRAILEGKKTQTRRVIKPQPEGIPYPTLGFVKTDDGWRRKLLNGGEVISHVPGDGPWKCPYGQPGDILWVRETWADLRGMGFDEPFAYLANNLNKNGEEDSDSKRCRLDYGVKWKPSIHMPREAARIFLKVKNVRVERLQDISEEDAKAEGVERNTRIITSSIIQPAVSPYITFRNGFAKLWDKINAKRGFGWDINPWVWVIEFEKAS